MRVICTRARPIINTPVKLKFGETWVQDFLLMMRIISIIIINIIIIIIIINNILIINNIIVIIVINIITILTTSMSANRKRMRPRHMRPAAKKSRGP